MPSMKFLLPALLLGAILAGAAGPASGDEPEGPAIPCKVTDKVEPAFPQRQYTDGVNHGEAELMLRIDPAGKLEDALVTAYSHKGFADSALEAVRRWRFAPRRRFFCSSMSCRSEKRIVCGCFTASR